MATNEKDEQSDLDKVFNILREMNLNPLLNISVETVYKSNEISEDLKLQSLNYTLMNEKLLREKDEVIKEKEEVIKGKDEVIKGKEEVIKGNEEVIKEKEEVIKDKEEVIKEKDEVIKEKDEVIKEKDKRQRESDCVGFLRTRGLPLLPKSTVSHSTPGYGCNVPLIEQLIHVPNVVIGIPDCCKMNNFDDLPSLIWKSTIRDKSQEGGRILRNWNNESQIEQHVQHVFLDVIALLKLEEKIVVSSKVTMTLVKRLIPDVVLLEVNGQVIGVCEVKQPSFKNDESGDFSILNDNLNNQISNYLLQLKNLYGISTPIGIISTYNEWKICFLHESYDYVISKQSSDCFQVPVKSLGQKNTLYTSKVYKYNDLELIEVLAAVTHKMYFSLVNPPTSLISGEKRKFGKVDKERFVWTSLSCKKLTYDMPPCNTMYFYFIQDFHGGKDGRVWLTVTNCGKVAVCKLSSDRTYDNEANLWNIIWESKLSNIVFTTTLLNANALVMPFIFHGKYDQSTSHVTFRPFGPKWASSVTCSAEDIRGSEVRRFIRKLFL